MNFAKVLGFWIEYKYKNTKMKRINVKHDYILPYSIQLKDTLNMTILNTGKKVYEVMFLDM